MGMKRLLLIFVLILSLIFSLIPSAAAANANEIIRQILVYYSHHQENAETDILRLLDQLEQIDPEAAEDWSRILETWRWAVEDLEVTWDILPDGLPEDDTLCIIVMGFQLGYGGAMDEELISRLEVALVSAEKYPNAYILCTGGGTAPSNPYVTEAGQMADWLEEHGIPRERIIVEDRSISTEENSLYAFNILSRDYPQVRSIALISSDYHLRRCYLLFTAGIQLANPDWDYTIVGDACFEAGYEGTHEGHFEEAKSLGKMLKMVVEHTKRPTLSQLTGITVEGIAEYTAGDPLSLTVTAEYDSGFTRDVTGLAEISGYEPSLDGAQELQIRYAENEVTAQTSFQIQVTVPPTTTPPTTAAPTVPPTTQPPAPTQPPAEPEKPGTDWTGITVFCGVGTAAIAILSLCLKPRRGKYEKRRKH